MPRKRHTAEEIVAKLRQADVLTGQGRPVGEAIRTIGVTEVTYYRWHMRALPIADGAGLASIRILREDKPRR